MPGFLSSNSGFSSPMNDVSWPSTFLMSSFAFLTALSRVAASLVAFATFSVSPDAIASAIVARFAASPSRTLCAAMRTAFG